MKGLLKVGLAAITLMWGSAAWAYDCPGSGQNDGSGNCVYFDGSYPNHPAGSIPMTGSQWDRRGNNSGGGAVVYRQLPDSWGAVAASASGAVGTASKQASKKASENFALRNCGEQGCKIVSTYSNQCVAAAWRVGSFITRNGLTPNEAEQKALAACSSKAKRCQIVVSECSLSS